jgi:hypothetical protein
MTRSIVFPFRLEMARGLLNEELLSPRSSSEGMPLHRDGPSVSRPEIHDQKMPSAAFDSSDIISGLHGGRSTISGRTSPTPGTFVRSVRI